MTLSRQLEHLAGLVPSVGAVALLVSLAAFPSGARAADLNIPVPSGIVYPGQNVLDKGVVSKAYKIPGDKLSAYVVENEMLGGKIARRTLLPGKPILLSDLKSPDIIKAGVATTMVYREKGLVITGLGTPLQSAGEGETLRVRNADSGIIVSGIAMADGTIEVSTQ